MQSANPHETFVKTLGDTQLRASDFIGQRVYVAENDYDTGGRVADADRTEWDDIGEINDVILNRGGYVAAVIVGVGGFLGIGEKDVAVNMSEIKFVTEDGDDPDDYFLVVKSARAALEAAPVFMDESPRTDRVIGYSNSLAETNAAMQRDMEEAERDMKAERPEYDLVMADQFDVSDLEGARIIGAENEDIGEVGEVMADGDGQITKVVLDIGGFLGMGEKHVALGADDLDIMRERDGDTLYVRANMTQEQLEKLPEYEKM